MKSKEVEFIISVLKKEIFKLQNDLKLGHWTIEQEEELMERLAKLNRSINMLHDNFVS
ncbi:hypothetical protein [Sporosarcina sp. FSL W7-1283]|uniref:hypothetical protein n=1 Tax=Sporosarcina sp. FSL W7-1283 TaxID=2921560 RepID=UPI0030F6B44D